MINFPNAKINIGLSIINRRSDNYHNIETIFYPVFIRDALEIIESNELVFSSSGLSIPGKASQNLCLKAYHLLRQDYAIPAVKIHLHKNVPIGAGLGGGSADAAACIRLLNLKFELGLDTKQMEDYAQQLGADCSFFIRNQTSFATQKGNVFHEINLSLAAFYLAIVVPPIHVSSQEAYAGVSPKKPAFSIKEACSLPIEQWKFCIKNDFEDSIFQKHPRIETIKNDLYQAGALYASMSGSGSSVYGIFKQAIRLNELEKNNLVFYHQEP